MTNTAPIGRYQITEHNQFGFKIGANKAKCPHCSPYRSDKNDRSLQLNWTSDPRTGYCHYCEKTIFIDKSEWVTDEAIEINPVLSQKLTDYFGMRGISQQTLIKLGVTEGKEWMPKDGREVNTIQFHYFLDGEKINTKYRSATKGFKLMKNAEKIPYNADAIFRGDELIIVEGEIDVLSVIEAGFEDVISVPNGASNNIEYLERFDEQIKSKNCVLIAVDNDSKGEKLKEALLKHYDNAVSWETEFKDANEALISVKKAGLAEIILKGFNASPISELLQLEITDATKAQEPEVLLRIGGSDMFTVGDISAIVGQAGHGKSLLVIMIVAEMINNTEDHFTPSLSGKVLWIDTEQSEWDVHMVRERIKKLANVDNLHIIKMREMDYGKRKDAILKLCEHFNPKLLIIDGITDIISNPLDLEESSKIVDELLKLSSTGMHVLGVIHQNEGSGTNWSNKARGHIGSEFIRKSEGIIQVKFENKKFHVSCLKGRHGKFEDFIFERDSVKGTPYFVGEREKTTSELGREEAGSSLTDTEIRNKLAKEMANRVEVIQACNGGATRRELVEILKTKDGYSKNKCEAIIKLMIEDGNVFTINEKDRVILAQNTQLKVVLDQDHDLPF